MRSPFDAVVSNPPLRLCVNRSEYEVRGGKVWHRPNAGRGRFRLFSTPGPNCRWGSVRDLLEWLVTTERNALERSARDIEVDLVRNGITRDKLAAWVVSDA